ncbi:MAG: hypothetical protein AB1758_12345 [Candidatus Eremiobacterota bacterium]
MDTGLQNLENFKKPKTDFPTCVGNIVVLYVKNPEELASLKLPLADGNRLEGRLVGVERQGLWMEPKQWMENAIEQQTELQHVFITWENVLSMVKSYPASDFLTVREYRGLRPRAT